jgi:hypothetical protein
MDQTYALRPKTNFLNPINGIPPIQSSREKYSALSRKAIAQGRPV